MPSDNTKTIVKESIHNPDIASEIIQKLYHQIILV